MDAKTLRYHNKVQDWTQMYRLGADGNIYKNSKLVTYLPPQKLQQIETWRKDVKQNCRPKSSQFPRLTAPCSDHFRYRAASAHVGRTRKNSGKTKYIWSSSSSISPGSLYSGTDLDSVTNHLAETSIHYAAQRDEIYSRNIPGKQLRKINKKQVQYDNNVKTTAEASQEIDKTSRQPSNGLNSEGEQDHTSDNLELQSDDEGSDTLSSISRMEGRGRVIHVNDHTMVQVRSQSNNLLNIISIDDCKMTNIYHSAKMKVEQRQKQLQSSNQIDETEDNKNGAVDELSEKDYKPESTSSKKQGSGPLSSKSVADCKTQIKHRTMKISKAIDEMVHDRKVMNSLDRNFDARIQPTGGRIILDKPEGGTAFKRLNSALRRHIQNVVVHQGHRSAYHKLKDGYSVEGTYHTGKVTWQQHPGSPVEDINQDNNVIQEVDEHDIEDNLLSDRETEQLIDQVKCV